jgi:hypothetical protein
MGQLTVEERRRIFIARQRRNYDLLTRCSAPAVASEPFRPRPGLNRIVKTAAIAVLLAAGWFACHAVELELHIPASIAEALPRLVTSADHAPSQDAEGRS